MHLPPPSPTTRPNLDPDKSGGNSGFHSLYMIGATGSVRGKKEFEPNSLAPESEPLLGPHLEDYWSIEDYWARSGGLLG